MKIQQLFFLVLFPVFAFAQNNEGRIVYNETIKLEIDVPEEHREQLKGILPDSRTAAKVLVFNANESIYKDQEGQDDEEVIEAGSEDSGMRMKMVMKRPDNQLYKNFEEETFFQKEDLFGRIFLVTDKVEKIQWKLVNDQKEILGYTCQMATMKNSKGKEVQAWFTTEIPVSNGPLHFGQLPGIILEVNVDDGQTHIVASKVELTSLEKGAIEAPSKGKKVTREEFDKIAAAKQKEMEEEYGSGGGRMIIKRRDN